MTGLEKTVSAPPSGRRSFGPGIFLLYLLSYGGQAIYSTYLNLYLSGAGISQSRIGLTVSVSTLFAMLAQMGWGVACDRARTRNAVLSFLFLGSAGAVMLFYVSDNYWVVLVVVSLYAAVNTGVMPVLDTTVMEVAEGRRWNFGQMRTGGTIGYCICVLAIGAVIEGAYQRIFWMTAVTLLLCFLLSLGIPKVGREPGEKKKRASFLDVLKNRALMALILFYLLYNMGLSFFYNFYPIYYQSIGGNSSQIGIMMFLCAVTEIPCLFLANRVVKRIGVDKLLIISGVVTTVRWLLLFLLRRPEQILLVSLLHGVGYTGFSYCIITYINSHVPKELRATSQSFNIMVGFVGARLLFGYVGGAASEAFGANWVMLVCAVILAAGTAVFFLWSTRHHEDYV